MALGMTQEKRQQLENLFRQKGLKLFNAIIEGVRSKHSISDNDDRLFIDSENLRLEYNVRATPRSYRWELIVHVTHHTIGTWDKTYTAEPKVELRSIISNAATVRHYVAAGHKNGTSTEVLKGRTFKKGKKSALDVDQVVEAIVQRLRALDAAWVERQAEQSDSAQLASQVGNVPDGVEASPHDELHAIFSIKPVIVKREAASEFARELDKLLDTYREHPE